MTGKTRAAAIADKHDLVTGVVDGMCGGPDLSEGFLQRQRASRLVSDFCLQNQPGQSCKVRSDAISHLLTHLRSPFRLLTTPALSIERRCPTISTLSAPTTLPMKPTRSNGPPAATSGAVTDRNASPAPTV